MGGLFGGGATISSSEPRLGAMRVQTSAFGYPIPLVYGTTRIPANLIWYGDFVAIPHTTTQSSGGKGGGGVETSNTSYTYQAAVAMGLCEGPIAGVGTVWASKDITSLGALGMTLFSGSYPQSPWSYLSTYHAGQALGYQGLAYVAAGAYQLGSSADLPNHSIEVAGRLLFGGGIVDANPRDVVTDFLTNTNYGAGFPTAKLADLTQFSNYCAASGLFMSPALSEQKQASDYLAEFARTANSALVWSEGVFKIIPYGDTAASGNGATYTPSITPVYDLTDDDFLGDVGTDPVIVTRKTQADAFNQVQVEFLNRANQYNVEIAEAKDQANVEQFGLRPMEPVQLHGICDASVARQVAQLILQRALYIRNVYEFKLGWRYCLLEPMDVVTLTDAALGLAQFQVRITEIEEDEEGALTVRAEEFPFGAAHSALYPSQAGAGYQVNYNATASSCAAPLIFEPPVDLTATGLELWLAVAGAGANWGGCSVHVSADGNTYKRVGMIHGPARYGTLTAALPSAAQGVDSANTLSVSTLAGQMVSGTVADLTALTTLMYVDGEFLAYRDAALTGVGAYNLTTLNRGAYDAPVSAHASGSRWARCDEAIFKYAIPYEWIGKTVYVKLTAFNVYGAGEQNLADVTPTSYVVTGAMLNLPPKNVDTFLVSGQADGTRQFTWAWTATTPPPDLDGYVIRYALGTSSNWDAMQPLHNGVLTASPFENNQLAAGSYTFAIRTIDKLGNLAKAADTRFISTTLQNPRLAGVLYAADIFADGWPGTKTSCWKDADTGYLLAADTATWATSFPTWAAWTKWARSPATPIQYDHPVIDLGTVTAVTPIVSAGGDGTITVQESHSTDGTNYSTYAATGALITARYIKIRIIATAATSGQLCSLKSAQVLLDAKPVSEWINDLATSSLTGGNRIGVGDVRLPVTKVYQTIQQVQITLQGTGAGWNWKLIDKTVTGPRIQIYNAAGALADCIIDAYVKGL